MKCYRCMKQFDSTKFCQDWKYLWKVFFNDMPELNLLNFNDAIQLFLNKLCIVINARAFLKQWTRRKKRLQFKPWISKGLYTFIRTKTLQNSLFERVDWRKKFFSKKKCSNLLTKLKIAAKNITLERNLNLHLLILKKLCKFCESFYSLYPINSALFSIIYFRSWLYYCFW